MGNECNEDDREWRYQTFHEGIFALDKDIINDLFNTDLSKKKYLPFALVNKGICQKYKFLANENFDRNEARKKEFNYKHLIKRNEHKNFGYIKKGLSFSFSSNFMFVNIDFLDVISNYIPTKYKAPLSTIYNIIIGGECLIMRDAHDINDTEPFRYIILYFGIKDDLGNEIDFFLNIKDQKERKAADDYILRHSLWNYFKKIKYDYKDEYKRIYNESKKEIGIIVRCSNVSRIEIYIAKMNSLKDLNQKNQQLPQTNQFPPNKNPQFPVNQGNMNQGQANIIQGFPLNNNQNPNFQQMPYPQFQEKPNSQISQNSSGNNAIKLYYPTGVAKKPDKNFNSDILLDPIITFLFQIDELKIHLSQNKNLDLQTFKNIIMTKIGPKVKKMKNFQLVLEELLTSLQENNKGNNEYYNQSEQYDEVNARKFFMDRHNKGNLIRKLFFIPKEEKILCKKCGMNTFNFGYDKYIYIKNPQTELIFQKLFTQKKGVNKGSSCNFCNGQFTEYSFETKFLDYPEKLIVIIESNQVNNFCLGLNLLITNGVNINYSLSKFIESNTNSLYWINEKNTNVCHKYINNGFGEPERIETKKPIVLFYNLKKNNINNINSQINIQNQSNQVNQNINSQNNAQPMNPNNINQVFGNKQQMNFIQNIPNMNMNPQNNFQNNFQNGQNQMNNNNINFQNNNFNNNFQNNFNNNIQMNFNNMNNDNMDMNKNSNMPNNFNNFWMNNNENGMNMQNQNNFMNFNNPNNNLRMNNDINSFNNMNNNNMNMFNNMNNNMNMMNNNNFQNNQMNNNVHLVDFNQIMVINFISSDHKIYRGIKCLPSDLFVKVEKDLYDIYPEYRHSNNNFVTNGNTVIKFQTLAENKIKDGQVIELIKID